MPAWDERVRIMDVHAEPIAKESWDFFFAFFSELRKLDKRVIVEGGWAVAAHGSPVASVDLDIIVRQDEYDDDHDYYDLLHGEGAYKREALSVVDWTFADFNVCWASAHGYDRAKLLASRTITTTLQAADGRREEITIPTLPALLVMKFKAFRDRELQFRVMLDPADIASYDPNEIDQINKDPDYRLRKAAKDLVDIGFLWHKADSDERKETVKLLKEWELADIVKQAHRESHSLVMTAADYLIDKHNLPGGATEIGDAILDALSEK